MYFLCLGLYKLCDKSTISAIHDSLRIQITQQQYETIIIGGDFNLHHPMWNPTSYPRQDEEADDLIEMMTDLELNLVLPPGTITFPNAQTTIDLVWSDQTTTERLIKCRIAEDHDHGSDHLPIQTVIDISQNPLDNKTSKLHPPYDYSKTNCELFNDNLQKHVPPPLSPDANRAHIDRFAEDLVNALTTTIQETTQRKSPCPRSKRWWTRKLTTLRRKTNKQRNVYRRSHHPTDKEAWRCQATRYTSEIAKAKEQHWKEFVNNADGKSIW